MIVPWWVYCIIVSAVFVLFLIGHYISKTLNEARLDERLERIEERTSVSTQVSLIIDKDKKKESNKNLKEDKRSKSVSLIFNTDKAQTDLTNNTSRSNEYRKGVKSNSSGDLKPFGSNGSSLNVPLHVKSLPEKLNVHTTEILGKDNQVNNVGELYTSSTKIIESEPKINESFIKPKHSLKNATLHSVINLEKNNLTKDDQASNVRLISESNKDITKGDIYNDEKSSMKTKVSIQNIILSSIRNDSRMKSNIAIQREPSSLFFGAICGTPSTPKEILERYENAFASAKSSKLEARMNLFDDNVSGSRYSAETSTSRPKSASELVSSKENLSATVSKVTFNPETKKSYIENILKDKPITNPEISISKLSVTTSKLSQTKDVSKCTSRVTFAKNTEIVIKDSSNSIEKHACMIAPSSEGTLPNDSETMCSSEFDLGNASNLNESKDSSNMDSKDVRKSPFKQSFIGEIVTVQGNTFKTNTKDMADADIENKNIEDTKTSQTSYDFHLKEKSEINILEQMALFNTKLTERFSIIPKDEASTSRSNNLVDYPEVIVVNNNKYSDDTELIRKKNKNITPFEKNMDYSNRSYIEIQENLLPSTSCDRLTHRTTQNGTKDDSKNVKEDGKDEEE